MMVENTPSSMIASELVKYKKHGIFFVATWTPTPSGINCSTPKPGMTLL